MKNKALETRRRIQNFNWDSTIEDITEMLTKHIETSKGIAKNLEGVNKQLIAIDVRITVMIGEAENKLADQLKDLDRDIANKQIEYDNSDSCFKSKDKGLKRAKEALQKFKNEMEFGMGAKLKKLPGLSKVVSELKKQGFNKKELIEDFEDEMSAKLNTLMTYVDAGPVLKKMDFHQEVMVKALGALVV